MDPLLTIVTPSYNHGRFLEKTIQSVLNQSFSDFRYLLWDDGSRDDSCDIIRRYADQDSRIVARVHDKHANKGLCETLASCIREVRTEYVAFLESDDQYKKDFLQSMVRCIGRHPDAALLFCRVEPFGNEEIIRAHRAILERKRRLALKSGADKADLLFNTPVTTFSGAVVKTGVVKKVRFDPGAGDELDHSVFTQLLCLGRTVFVDRALVRWQKYPESYSALSKDRTKYQSFRMRFELCYPDADDRERALLNFLLLERHPRLEKGLRKQARFLIKYMARKKWGDCPLNIVSCPGRP